MQKAAVSGGEWESSVWERVSECCQPHKHAVLPTHKTCEGRQLPHTPLPVKRDGTMITGVESGMTTYLCNLFLYKKKKKKKKKNKTSTRQKKIKNEKK